MKKEEKVLNEEIKKEEIENIGELTMELVPVEEVPKTTDELLKVFFKRNPDIDKRCKTDIAFNNLFYGFFKQHPKDLIGEGKKKIPIIESKNKKEGNGFNLSDFLIDFSSFEKISYIETPANGAGPGYDENYVKPPSPREI